MRVVESLAMNPAKKVAIRIPDAQGYPLHDLLAKNEYDQIVKQLETAQQEALAINDASRVSLLQAAIQICTCCAQVQQRGRLSISKLFTNRRYAQGESGNRANKTTLSFGDN